MEIIPTAPELAKADIIRLIESGRVTTAYLMDAMLDKGHAKSTVGIAKRELKRDGIITIARPGGRANPFFVTLIEA